MGWQMVPPYKEPIIWQFHFGGMISIYILATQFKTTTNIIDNNEEQLQQRTKRDRPFKKDKQEGEAEG